MQLLVGVDDEEREQRRQRHPVEKLRDEESDEAAVEEVTHAAPLKRSEWDMPSSKYQSAEIVP